MKKIIPLITLLFLVLASCKKEEAECCDCSGYTPPINPPTICENTPYEGSADYDYVWETLAPLFGTTDWEGTKANINNLDGCQCD